MCRIEQHVKKGRAAWSRRFGTRHRIAGRFALVRGVVSRGSLERSAADSGSGLPLGVGHLRQTVIGKPLMADESQRRMRVAFVAHFTMTPAIAMLRMIHTMFIDMFARREESRILRQHRRGCAEGDSGNRRLLAGVLVKNLRFPSYLPESSCDLFPVSDAIVVPTNES